MDILAENLMPEHACQNSETRLSLALNHRYLELGTLMGKLRV